MSENDQGPTETILVVDVPERSRFEISLDAMPAGYAEYVDGEEVRVFPHTVIDEAYAGRGLATELIRTALDSSRAKGLAVVPECPAVRRFIAKRPEYVDLVPERYRSDFGL